MLEAQIEKYLKREIEKLGGASIKFLSPSMVGVPDRIVVLKGRIWFVELKTERGVVSKVQLKAQGLLLRLGLDVRTLKGISEVKKFIEEVKTYNNEIA